jgi:hypothetical protein
LGIAKRHPHNELDRARGAARISTEPCGFGTTGMEAMTERSVDGAVDLDAKPEFVARPQ